MSRTRDDHAVERELLDATRAGDNEAFAALYLRHHDSALAYAHSLTHSARAPDLLAEAVLRIYRLLRDGKGPQTAFRTYLFMTIRSVNIDALRRSGREIPVGEILETADTAHSDSSEALADCDTILRAFRTLPGRWQDVLWATAVEGRTVHELGSELDLAPNSVSVLAKRAREGLRQAYLSQHIETTSTSRRACEPYARDLARYVRRSLVPNRLKEVHAHLEGCTECAVVVAGLDSINTHLGAVLLPAALVALGGSTVGAGVLPAAEPLFRTVLGALKAKAVELPGLLAPALGGTTAAGVAGVAGSVVIAASATVGVVHWRADHSPDRPASATSQPAPGLVRDELDHGAPLSPTAVPTPYPATATAPVPPGTTEPTSATTTGPRPTPAPAAVDPTSPAPTSSLPAMTAPPAPEPAATPTSDPVLMFTYVGSCAMEEANVVCTDPSPGGPVLVLTPTDGGTCSTGDQTADCLGPLTISDRSAPDPDTGQPQVLYTQSGSTERCMVRDQTLTCYRGS